MGCFSIKRTEALISSHQVVVSSLIWNGWNFWCSSEMRNYKEICMSLCSFICICTSGSNSYLCFKVFGIWSRCVKKNIILADISLLIAPGTNHVGCTLNFQLLHALIYQTNTDCSDKINICSEIVGLWEANFHKYINSVVFQLVAFSFNSNNFCLVCINIGLNVHCPGSIQKSCSLGSLLFLQAPWFYLVTELTSVCSSCK